MKCKYEKREHQISYDGGQTWITDQIIKGDLIEVQSADCPDDAYIDRWIVIDGAYLCDGKNKYKKEAYQVSYDDGLTWYYSTPMVYRLGDFVAYDENFCNNLFVGHYEFGEIPSPWKPKVDPLKIVKSVGQTELTKADSNYYNDNSIPESDTKVSLKSCEIGDDITSIGHGAFYACRSLQNITIPSGVTSIGNNAFFECISLEYIKFDSITPPTIYNSSFTRTNCPILVPCESVSDYKIAQNWTTYSSRIFPYGSCGGGGYAFIATYSDSTIQSGGCAGYSSISSEIFNNSLVSLDIGDCITGITEPNFTRYYNLTDVTIGSGITDIAAHTFYECSALTSVTINATTPPSIYYSFYGNDRLKIYVPCNSINAYLQDENWSYYSDKLRPIQPCELPVRWLARYSGGSTDEMYCFNSTSTTLSQGEVITSGLTSIQIGNCITEIGDRAFELAYDAPHLLSSVTIPDSVTSISNNVFVGYSGLTSITLPSSLITIGERAFNSCGLRSITIPDSVTTIVQNAFLGCSGLTSIEIGSGVTTIGDGAFSNCSALTSVTINATTPPTLSGPGNRSSAFYGSTCPIYVPCECVSTYMTANEKWAEYASRIQGIPPCQEQFKWSGETSDSTVVSGRCNSSTTLSDSEVSDYKSGLTSVIIGECTTIIGSWAFSSVNTLSSVTISDSVTSIGTEAFYGCGSLTSIIIPNSVTSLDYAAFSHCSALTSITIPNSVTTIGNEAFSNCSALTSITIPSRVTSISNEALYHCYSLTSITIPNSVTSIGRSAFEVCSGLTSVTIPDSVISIGVTAFNRCGSISSITIGSGVTNIDYAAFSNCSALTSVTINAITPPSMGTRVFNSSSINMVIYVPCQSLDTYKAANGWSEYAHRIHGIPPCVEPEPTIGKYSIITTAGTLVSADCDASSAITSSEIGNTAIYTLEIGDCVTELSGSTFSSKGKMVKVTFGNNVTTVGNSAFYNCTGLTDVTIKNLHNWCSTDFGNTGSTSYYSNPLYYAHHLYYNGQEITNLVIPSGVTYIGVKSFVGGNNITAVTIPNTVTRIGNWAFVNCSGITSVTIPDSVTTIGYGVFSGCTSLTSATIGSGVTSMSVRNFQGCTALTNVNIPSSLETIPTGTFVDCTSLPSITIPNSITAISDYAFVNCYSLTSVDIPSSVYSIGTNGFKNCSGLTSVTINATVPPMLGNVDVFYGSTCPIYVPSGSVETYKTTTGWVAYADRIQAIPNS